MRLGIDFGTTRIAAASVDRGNYPVVSFECPDGGVRDWFPPLVAARAGELRYGWEAWNAQGEAGWTVLRSLKRLLGHAGLETPVEIGERTFPLHELLGGLAAAFRDELLERSNLDIRGAEPLEVMLGVPANSNGNQRFLTAEAFRLAGFAVLGVLNEPSAASIEFGHRLRAGRRSAGKGFLLVYDLGGGTFDVSLVEIDELTHSVLASEGIETLGGDDFDEMLAELALEKSGLGPAARETLSQAEVFRLHEECRERKESVHPNTRKITVDLECVRPGLGEVTVPVGEFYDACRPLLEETLNAVEDLLSAHGFEGASASSGDRRLEAVYVTGGGSEMPLVTRELRERYERRVKRSAHARSATAIGLAIQAGAQAGYLLRDRFTRYFGVWREAEGGARISFDPLFHKGETLPGPGAPSLLITRRYHPVHNVGHFRYLECGRIAGADQPAGDITLWDEVRFPFDPSLEGRQALEAVPVERSPAAAAQSVEEVYACDAGGTVTVTIANLTSGHSRAYRLARWAPGEAPLKPGRKRSPRTRAR